MLLEARPRRRRDLDPPRLAARLHPGGHVHRVAPQVEEDPPAADDATHDPATREADPDRETEVMGSVPRRYLLEHATTEGQPGVGVVRPRIGRPADSHVGIADRLDLLDAELGREAVEAAEQ